MIYQKPTKEKSNNICFACKHVHTHVGITIQPVCVQTVYTPSGINTIPCIGPKFPFNCRSTIVHPKCNWAGENNWLVPPLNLVNRVIRHCLACGAFGTLVVPKWESSPFWPVIFHSNSLCMHYISDVLEFKDLNDIYIYGSNKKSLFGSERFNLNMPTINKTYLYLIFIRSCNGLMASSIA
jgi:hypothetical protein